MVMKNMKTNDPRTFSTLSIGHTGMLGVLFLSLKVWRLVDCPSLNLDPTCSLLVIATCYIRIGFLASELKLVKIFSVEQQAGNIGP